MLRKSRVSRDRARGMFITGLVVTATLLSSRVHAQDGIEFVDSLLWSKAYDIVVGGDHAYCAFLNGLLILDISDERAPVFVSRLYLGGGNALAKAGDLIFVAAGSEGLRVIDVSDVRDPVEVGRFPTAGDAMGVAVIEGTRALVAAGEAGLQIIEMSHPQAPRPVSVIDTPGKAGAVVMAGDLACVADGPGGIHLIDVADPSTPIVLGSIDTPGNAERVALSGRFLHVADGSRGSRSSISLIRDRRFSLPHLPRRDMPTESPLKGITRM